MSLLLRLIRLLRLLPPPPRPSSSSSSSVAVFRLKAGGPLFETCIAWRRRCARSPPPANMGSPKVKDWPESVVIRTKGGGHKRIASPWVYQDDYGTWVCGACEKELCESHALSKDHGRKVWYYCYGYGKGSDGRLPNAIQNSVRHNEKFNYGSSSSSMLEHTCGVVSAAAGSVPDQAQPGCRWANAVKAVAADREPANELTPVEQFKIDDASSPSQSISQKLGESIDQKLDAVLSVAGTMEKSMRSATELIEKLERHAQTNLATEVVWEAKITELKDCFETHVQLTDTKINEYKQAIESKVPALTAQMTEVKTSFESKMPNLEAKIDEVKKTIDQDVQSSLDAKWLMLENGISELKQSLESKVPIITFKIDEVKHSFESQDAKIDALTDQIRALEIASIEQEARQPALQGSASLGLRRAQSTGSLSAETKPAKK